MKKIQQQIKKIILFGLLMLGISIIYSSPAYAEDRFKCFTQSGNESCTKALNTSTECRLQYDYTINVDDVGGDGVVLSIHGGSIEPYTSELAQQVADKLTWKRYDFFGHATPLCSDECSNDASKNRIINFRNLHITSTEFNDERALTLVKNNSRTVSVHGYSPRRTDDRKQICVGGRNTDTNAENRPNRQAARFIEYINNQSGLDLKAINARKKNIGLPCGEAIVGTTEFKALRGSAKKNIVNQNPSHEGLQLEFHLDLLEGLATDLEDPQYQTYLEAILNAVDYAVAEENAN